MNKVAINTLCILILAVLGASVLLPGIGMGYFFTQGLQQGYAQTENPDALEEDGYFIDAVPVSVVHTPQALRDTLRFDNGEEYPVTYATIRVQTGLNQQSAKTPFLITCGSVLVILVLFILLAIKFVKFVIHINKGEIFSKRNIRLLSWIGIFLILIAVLQITMGIADDLALSGMELTLEGTEMTAYWSIPWSNLLMGLLAMLMSQIWRRGWHLKQEQELTI